MFHSLNFPTDSEAWGSLQCLYQIKASFSSENIFRIKILAFEPKVLFWASGTFDLIFLILKCLDGWTSVLLIPFMQVALVITFLINPPRTQGEECTLASSYYHPGVAVMVD